jgi:hypothetical protein
MRRAAGVSPAHARHQARRLGTPRVPPRPKALKASPAEGRASPLRCFAAAVGLPNGRPQRIRRPTLKAMPEEDAAPRLQTGRAAAAGGQPRGPRWGRRAPPAACWRRGASGWALGCPRLRAVRAGGGGGARGGGGGARGRRRRGWSKQEGAHRQKAYAPAPRAPPWPGPGRRCAGDALGSWAALAPQSPQPTCAAGQQAQIRSLDHGILREGRSYRVPSSTVCIEVYLERYIN